MIVLCIIYNAKYNININSLNILSHKTVFIIISQMFDVLTDMMSNLKIEEDEEMSNFITHKKEEYILPTKYSFILDTLSKIVINEPILTIEIIDNVFIIDNKLFGLRKKPLCLMNLSIDNEKNNDNKDEALYIPILQLPEFYDERIPQKFDTNWWDSNCDEFDECMHHLMNDSVEFNYNLVFNVNDYIIENIIELTLKLVQKMYVNKRVEYDILKMYEIACYLERYFYNEKIGLFFTNNHDITSKYFTEFNKLALKNVRITSTIYYSLNRDLYIKNINRSLLNILNCSKNILILFGPYGFDAIQKNEIFFKNLDFQAIFDFKREALRYFALNNLIIQKLNNKSIQLFNPNDYVNFIFKGASYINL